MNDTAKRRRVRAECRANVGQLSADFRSQPNVFIVSVSSLIKMQIRHAPAAAPPDSCRPVLSYNPHCIRVSYVPLLEHIVC